MRGHEFICYIYNNLKGNVIYQLFGRSVILFNIKKGWCNLSICSFSHCSLIQANRKPQYDLPNIWQWFLQDFAFFFSICILISQAIAQPNFLDHFCLDNRVTTQATVTTMQASITSSPPSPPTQKLTMGSTIFRTAKILTKYMHLDFVEEMLSQIFAVVASITLRIF